MSELSNVWHEEYKLIVAALKTINDSQGSLKVESEFKGDRAVFKSHIDTLFRGHNIRKDTYEALSKYYVDFGEVFKDLDKAATPKPRNAPHTRLLVRTAIVSTSIASQRYGPHAWPAARSSTFMPTLA